MSLDVGFWLLIRFFLFSIMPSSFNWRCPSRYKEAECWTFSGKSTHTCSSWKIRLLLIIFGTYIQLNRVYMCPFVWFFKYFWATDTSDHQPFRSMNLRTIECPGILVLYLTIHNYCLKWNMNNIYKSHSS
jgi:hypothetical protein